MRRVHIQLFRLGVVVDCLVDGCGGLSWLIYFGVSVILDRGCQGSSTPSSARHPGVHQTLGQRTDAMRTAPGESSYRPSLFSNGYIGSPTEQSAEHRQENLFLSTVSWTLLRPSAPNPWRATWKSMELELCPSLQCRDAKGCEREISAHGGTRLFAVHCP